MMEKKIILAIIGFAVGYALAEAQPVIVNKDMIVNEVGSGEAMKWFDEQDATAVPVTRWQTSGNTACWPAGLVIDLGREFLIDSIRLFDMEKAYRAEGGRLEIATGRPFEWSVVAIPEGAAYISPLPAFVVTASHRTSSLLPVSCGRMWLVHCSVAVLCQMPRWAA